MENRLAKVSSLYYAAGKWCIFINVWPPTSLVTLDSGLKVSMDPTVMLDTPVAPQQYQFLLERRRVKQLFPVMRIYAGREKTMVYFIPE